MFFLSRWKYTTLSGFTEGVHDNEIILGSLSQRTFPNSLLKTPYLVSPLFEFFLRETFNKGNKENRTPVLNAFNFYCNRSLSAAITVGTLSRRKLLLGLILKKKQICYTI
jgi:hypothetical protein